MRISQFSPHIWMKTTRLTPDLGRTARPGHDLRCGFFSYNLQSSSSRATKLFSAFPYLGFEDVHPPYMAVCRFLIIRQFDRGQWVLSTEEETFPQIRGSYPQNGGSASPYCLNKYPKIWGVRPDRFLKPVRSY